MKALICLALCLTLTSCGLMYDRSHQGFGFTIYSNQDKEFTQEAAHRATSCRHMYQQLFNLSNKEIGTFTIFLKGGETKDLEPDDLLGYYISPISWIVISTNINEVREQLSTVLLHEVAHHFIVTDHPDVEPWLDEGLAGALEVTLYNGWHYEFLLFNLPLFEWCRSHEVSKQDLIEVITGSWDNFHESEKKGRNYAIAWSMVFYLLEEYLDNTKSLSERIKILYTLEEDSLLELTDGWHEFLYEFNVDQFLRETGKDRRSTLKRLWALRMIISRLKGAN